MTIAVVYVCWRALYVILVTYSAILGVWAMKELLKLLVVELVPLAVRAIKRAVRRRSRRRDQK